MLTAPTEDPLSNHVGHARQQIVYGREKGNVFGAFGLATDVAFNVFNVLYTRRTFAHQVSFLEQVDTWLPADQPRIDAFLDNPGTHCAVDMLLLPLTHSRWKFVFQIAAGPDILPCHDTFDH